MSYEELYEVFLFEETINENEETAFLTGFIGSNDT